MMNWPGVDPVAAASIRLGDPQRLIPGGRDTPPQWSWSPSHWQRHNRIARMPALRLVVTAADRVVLHQRIEQRLEQMMKQGFIGEVEALRHKTGSDP